MEIISEELITDAEAKEILLKREKKGELKYEQKNALNHLKKFVTIDSKKAQALAKELKKIEKLRERHIVAIINTMPKDKADMRAVLHKEYNSFTEDEIKLILDKVNSV
jgi:DNA-directed RNA polymerase subunit F